MNHLPKMNFFNFGLAPVSKESSWTADPDRPLVRSSYGDFNPHRFQREAELLRPFDDHYPAVEIVLQAEIFDFGRLIQAVEVEMKDKMPCLIDIEQRVGRATYLGDVPHPQPRGQAFGENGLSRAQFTDEQDDFIPAKTFGQLAGQPDRFLFARSVVFPTLSRLLFHG
jgi:hypothetical protein